MNGNTLHCSCLENPMDRIFIDYNELQIHGDFQSQDMTEQLSTKNIFLKLIIFWDKFVTFIIRKKKKAFKLHGKV